MKNGFRNYLFPLDSPRLVAARRLNPYEFGRAVLDFPPAAALIRSWRNLAEQPFKGITTDGTVIPGLFQKADEGAPVRIMVEAARGVLSILSPSQLEALCYPIDAPEWRHWSNPEFLINPNGLRLEELSERARDAVLHLFRSTLSPTGYTKARGCMHTNAFLGELCNLPRIMNEWSYNFLLFGVPTEEGPWGWSVYGHHLVLNCFVLGSQMVISPTFMGAEPNVIDAGPHAGLKLFDAEEKLGLALMRSLPELLRDKAVIYEQLHDPAMPEGRWNRADQRHLGGAFQDNRIVPYEGVPASAFDRQHRHRLMTLVAAFIEYLPGELLAARLKQIESHLDHTWWSWIGGYAEEDPFYYRIQSPVVMIEFDHHSGVWLSNEQPAKCHIHTVVRTPNGNDYGKDLLRQHYAQVHPGSAPGTRDSPKSGNSSDDQR
jgi:hypothetical protein